MTIKFKREKINDEKLIRYYTRGDEEALVQLVKRHQKNIYNLSFRFMNNSQDAWDATQETFIRLIKRAKSFKGASKFSTWLYRITCNVCKDILIKRKKLISGSYEELKLTEKVTYKNRFNEVSNRILEAEETDKVQNLLQKLPQNLRIVIVLNDIYDLKYKEISEILNIPLGTVKSRISRSREILRNILKEEREQKIDF